MKSGEKITELPKNKLMGQETAHISILSTKKLASHQKELLLNSGIGLVEQNFISIIPIKFSTGQLPKNIIFTSQNSVKLVLEKYESNHFAGKKIFCVGEKTARALEEKGLEVTRSTHYGSDLAEKIVEDHSEEEFLFFCGKKRRPELPNYLKRHNVNLTEVAVYDTELVPKKIDRVFDGLLFFSPSAVKSFIALNKFTASTVFCIGKTTAFEARKYTENVITAAKPTIENVLVQVVKHFR